ncbi:MAG: DUF924 family protein [Deltaproteobacteria bacterium]
MGIETRGQRQELILKFWFGELKEGEVPTGELRKMWWTKDEETDEYIRSNFESDLVRAKNGKLRGWENTPKGALALIILLDQFSRNIYRGTPGAFSQDKRALGIALEGIEKGFDKELHPVERTFFYMPFMHSEDPGMQRKSLRLFGDLEMSFNSPPKLAEMLSGNRKYAERHCEIIERFGRYPHRNEILGRGSTDEEREFLTKPGSSF